LIFLFKNF